MNRQQRRRQQSGAARDEQFADQREQRHAKGTHERERQSQPALALAEQEPAA